MAYVLALYSACLLRVLRVIAHGRLVVGIVAQDMPMLHRALFAEEYTVRIVRTREFGGHAGWASVLRMCVYF